MRKHHVRPEKPESTTETIPAMIKQTKAKLQKSKLVNKYSIIAVTVLFSGIGGYFIINSFAASTVPPTQANLWVAPGGSTNCTRSNSPTDYVVGGANVCDSINSAWNKCLNASNDKVVIKQFTG